MSMSRPKNIPDEDWRERQKKYRDSKTEEQKERKNEQDRRRRANRTEEQKEHDRAYGRNIRANRTEEQKEMQRAGNRRWRANMTEERAAIERERGCAIDQVKRGNLTDYYIRRLLKGQGFNFTGWGAEPPQELIELKRVQLKIRRYLSQGEQI